LEVVQSAYESVEAAYRTFEKEAGDQAKALLAAVHESDSTSRSLKEHARELNVQINSLHEELKKVKKSASEAIKRANEKVQDSDRRNNELEKRIASSSNDQQPWLLREHETRQKMDLYLHERDTVVGQASQLDAKLTKLKAKHKSIRRELEEEIIAVSRRAEESESNAEKLTHEVEVLSEREGVLAEALIKAREAKAVIQERHQLLQDEMADLEIETQKALDKASNGTEQQRQDYEDSMEDLRRSHDDEVEEYETAAKKMLKKRDKAAKKLDHLMNVVDEKSEELSEKEKRIGDLEAGLVRETEEAARFQQAQEDKMAQMSEDYINERAREEERHTCEVEDLSQRLVAKTNECTHESHVIEELEQQRHDFERRALEAEAKLTEFQLAARQAAVAQVEAEIKKQKAQLQNELHAVDRSEHEAARRMEESKKSAVAAAGKAVAEAAAPMLAAALQRESPTKRFCATAVPPMIIGPPVGPPFLGRGDPRVPPILPGTLEEVESLRQQWL